MNTDTLARLPDPTALLQRLRSYAAWGDLPSIAPHVETCPGMTTGRVLMDTWQAAEMIENLAAQRIADAEAIARLTAAAENVVIARSMGWDMDGVTDALEAAIKEAAQ